MAQTFQVEIITPTSHFTETDVSYVRAESVDGQFGVMSHHTPATIALGIGAIKLVKDGKDIFYATSGGFADIQSDSVLLLVETAEKMSGIDKDRAEAAHKRALDRLQDNAMDKARAKASLARSKNRLKILTN